MKLLSKGLLSILVCAQPATIAFAQVSDGCVEVLKYSARDYSLEKSDVGIAVRVYDQYCENALVKSGSQFNADLGAIIQSIPVKFSFGSGSTEERTKYFCKTFDAEYKRNEQFYRSTSLVVDKTTTAWLACKTLASQGVFFRPQISKAAVLIEIVRYLSAEVRVEGIDYNHKLGTCTVPNSASSSTVVVADGKTVKQLAPGSWTITCERKPEATPTETIYPEFIISVKTDKGPFLLTVVPDAKFPYHWASELQQQVNSTKTGLGIALEDLTSTKQQLQATNKQLQAVGASSENTWTWQIPGDNNNSALYACPPDRHWSV